MRKMFSVRIEEETQHDLKLIAALERRSMGVIIDEMVKERVTKLQRLGTLVPLALPAESEAPSAEARQEKKTHRGKRRR